jgi:hypothetical protein
MATNYAILGKPLKYVKSTSTNHYAIGKPFSHMLTLVYE